MTEIVISRSEYLGGWRSDALRSRRLTESHRHEGLRARSHMMLARLVEQKHLDTTAMGIYDISD